MSLDDTRRRILQLAGTTAIASIAGCASVAQQFSTGEQDHGEGGSTSTSQPGQNGGQPSTDSVSTRSDRTASTEADDDSWSTDSVTLESPDLDLSGIPVPDGQSSYARMGRDDAAVTATVIGNWKCPYTQEFVLELLPEIVDRFVDSGDLQVEYRSLAYLSGDPFLGTDAPRAARAGLAVWDIDPESYWSYFAHLFANQPQERYEWAQPSFLVRVAETSGVSGITQFRQSVTNGAYAGPVHATTDTAADLGVSTVPRVAVDGTVTAPTVDFQDTLAQIERAVE
ncbi:DsbA family protein [Halobellus captivus]|uniref:DsbA family protein n=1 Tax=Halobellus captivus TaxID=2592614 RepID=UPI001396AD3D|nr:thioredoxin domain-containing protein [Halobellus captivus]